jgi:hypothetical protein
VVRELDRQGMARSARTCGQVRAGVDKMGLNDNEVTQEMNKMVFYYFNFRLLLSNKKL